MQKHIYIVSQSGIKPEYAAAVEDGVKDFMAMFPEYKDDYPITYLGRWHDNNSVITALEHARVPPEKRNLYIPTTDGNYLVPYASTDWSMAIAKYSAFSHGRPQQIDASMLLDLMANDPTVAKIPQIDIHLVKDDAFAMSDGHPNNFVYGVGQSDTGFVLSVKRFEQMYGDNPEYLKEVIKTIAIHELGHVFKATVPGRHNVANRDGYGLHCDCLGCVMRTDTRAKPNVLTNDRLDRVAHGEPPLCPECIAMTRFHFAELSGNFERQQQAALDFNLIKRRTRDYS
ncbi:MAG: hypothetical protein Q4D11_04670 [Rhodospirillales bacterium]|nr:hypothetical protein [Rhodospirillales bacterium]